MEDENIFSYGPYKLYKDAFDVNIRENLDKYIRTAGLTSQEEQDFRAAVDFINQGIGSYITSMSGSGTFRDNKGYLKKDNRGHQHAAMYIHTIANKQGALGNATPKEKPLAEEPSKEFFDPKKHFIGVKFETEYNPTGLDSDYSYWKDTANGTTLHEHLRNYIKTNYLDKGFDQYDFSKTNVTSDYYKGMLNSLYTSLADGVSDDDIKKMQILGFKNPLAFKPVVDDPKLNGNGQENDPTAGKTVLTGDDIADIKAQGFQFGKNNWLDTEGKDTGIPLDQDPRNQNPVQPQEQQGHEEDISFTDIANVAVPLLLDITNLVSPEPISSALAGYGSDVWNFLADDNKLANIGKHLTNVGLTTVSLLPYAGDFGTLGKIGNGIQKILDMKGSKVVIGGALSYLAVNYGPDLINPIIESVNKAYNKEEMTLQDYANFGQLLMGLIQVTKAGKLAYNNQKINSASTIQGDAARVTTKEGRHIFQGDEAKKVQELSGEELNKYLKDFGIEQYDFIEFNNNKGWFNRNIYNPETAKNTAANYGKRTQSHTQNVVSNDKMATKGNTTPDTPSAPRTTGKPKLDDLRAKVEAKLKGERGLTDDEVKEIDQLLRKLSENAPKKSYLERLKDLGKSSKPRKEYTEAKEALINKGKYTADEADELLKGFFKQGGILKASTGLKINANDINLQSYKDWDKYFTYNDTDKTYSLIDGYDGEALTKWGADNGLNITLPSQVYGTDKYVYTPQSSLYKEGATSIGFIGANDKLRSDYLQDQFASPDKTKEIDLNAHAESRKMYQQVADAEKGLSSGEQLRRGDFLNWFKNNYKKGMSLEQTLELYNSGIDKMYAFKQSDKGITYTGGKGQGNSETGEFADLNLNYYTSQNTPHLHGWHEGSKTQNGSTMMGRSVDRTKVTIAPFTEEELKEFDIYKGDDGLFNILSTNSFTNDGTGRYYVGNPELTITKREGTPDPKDEKDKGNGGNEEGEVSIPGNDSNPIGANGDPLLRNSSPDLSPLFSAFNYYNALRTNRDILKLSKKLPTLLYDPVEHHRSIYGNLRAVQEGQRQAAELRSIASRPLTSDGSLQMAAMMDAQNQGQKYVEAGFKADDEMMRQTSEAAWQQEKENKISRHQTAMKNRENMHQTAVTKLQAEATKKSADYQSTKLFVDEMQKYYITEKAKRDKKQDAVYALNLQYDIYKNPQNYLADWNSYHDGIWKRGIKGQPLGDSEKQIFNELKQKAQQIYYNFLYYNTANVDTSVKDVASVAADFSVVRALQKKKGGTIDVDLAKVVLGYIKEANKNYNKAVDRSAKGMYNYIKQQRKKK